MPSRNIQGITIEIDGNTTKLGDSLKDVNGKLRDTEKALRDVDKLLKLDPGNVDLIKQKQELLKTAVEQTKDRLDQEKNALEQLRNSPDMANHTQEMQALERQIADDEIALKNLEEETKSFGSTFKQEMQAAGDKLKEVGEAVGDVGEKMTKSLTVPIVATGTAAVAAFTEVDKGYDVMIAKTGAAGEAADEMRGIIDDLATSIPTDFETAGAAVGEVNTRFGLTGSELEDLSGKFIKFARLNNVDVSSAIDDTQKAMAAYGIATEDTGAFLDRLNLTAQQTGVDTGKLTSGLISNATAFQEMGLSADQAVSFMGQLEKSGANSETVLNGMRKALKNAAAEGKPLDQALSELQETILNGSDGMDGLTAAYDLFGKSGDQIYGAIKAGSLDFNALAAAAEDAGGSIENTFSEVLSPTDQFQTTLNSLKATGAEVGGTILEMVAPALEAVANAIKSVKEWWEGLSPETQKVIITVAGIVAAIGPLISILGGIISAVGTLSTVIGLLSGPIGIVVAAIAAAIAIGVLLYKNWDTIKEKAGELKDNIVETWNKIKTGVSEKVNAVKENISNAWSSMKDAVSEKVTAMKDMIGGKLDAIKQAYQNAGGGIKGIVSGMMEGVKQYFTLGFDALNTITGGKLNAVKDKISTILTSAKNIVSNIIGSIKNLFNFSWSLPKLKLPHFRVSGGKIPWGIGGVGYPPSMSIDWYRKAYDEPVMFTSPTILQTPQGLKGFGDGIGNEIVIGQNKLMSMISQASGRNSGPVNIAIYPTPSQNAKEIAQEVSSILYGQYQATGY